MAVKVRFGSNNGTRSGNGTSRSQDTFMKRLLRYGLIVVLVFLLIGATVFGAYYYKYQQVVDERLNNGPLFASTAQIYAGAREVRVGQKLSAAAIASDLRRAGYNANSDLGTFQLRGESIMIKPGPQSFHSTDGATITSPGGEVAAITAENGVSLRAYELEPQLITGLSEDKNRTKRRLVTYKDIPPQLVQAVTAIEDRRFFEHGGINIVRTIKCGVQDIMSHRMNCGGSTLTQQLARGFFLSPEKHIKRKLIEILISFQLESRFSKPQIFEMYANQVPLGQRGSFAINGFGEASQAYFGKDMKQLNLPECALLAGIIQRPSYFNPYKHMDRALDRRNIVLQSMADVGDITESEAENAKAQPIRLAPPNVDASEAPYFVDLVHDQLVQRLGDSGDQNRGALRIYTSLDPDLQLAASEAVSVGMQAVDEMVRKRHKGAGAVTYPQVSLVALNPHTGQVLALVGGRNYGVSQLNHATSMRPTGSIFKPFVYATAFAQSVHGQPLADGSNFTALTMLNDDPQDFGTGGQSYTPGNFERGEYPGMVTASTALEHSLNIATIALAQKVGYENVAALARSSGILAARPTPSVAIGTYSATPLDMAGAYTVFANNGVHLNPWLLTSVRDSRGGVVADFTPEARQVLDPRVAFLTQSMLEGVMARGTGSAARSFGFNAPAAGKTGTSHDVWFAGYSSNLLCIVWVGNDDYTNLELEGAKAAAPIWAEFMKRAILLPQYSDMHGFNPPDGVGIYRIDRASNQLADDSCPNSYNVAFLSGTQPQSSCSQMGEDSTTLLQKLFGGRNNNGNPPNGQQPQQPAPPPTSPYDTQPDDGQPQQQPKKRNFFQKLFGVGGDKKQEGQ